MILVVDDDPDAGGVLARLLTRGGYPACHVDSVKGALEVMEHVATTMVITDLMMPHRDGFDLLRAMGRDGRMRDVPVLVFTAIAPSREWECRSLGAKDYVTKGSANWPQLLERVRALLPHDAHEPPSDGKAT